MFTLGMIVTAFIGLFSGVGSLVALYAWSSFNKSIELLIMFVILGSISFYAFYTLHNHLHITAN